MINADQRRDDLPRPMGEAPFMSMWSNIGAELKLSEEVAAAPLTDNSHSSSPAAETPLETRLSKLPAATI